MFVYRTTLTVTLSLLLCGPAVDRARAQAPVAANGSSGCTELDFQELRRNPTEEELRCRFGVEGPGRFGLLSYLDVPVYQTDTPMPGTHVVAPGNPGPWPGESYEHWEWRMLRTDFSREGRTVHRELELLHPFVAARIMRFEQLLREAGVRAVRRETWRSPARQAYLFQQGRTRPGPLATTTLTSSHSRVDERGRPAGRAVDYDVAPGHMKRFHQLARAAGLETYGADSNDPSHVFFPDPDEVPEAEVILLRVLPRVPEVTLATGLPVDRSPPPGGATTLRLQAREFAYTPFLPYVPPELAPRPLRAPVLEKVGPADSASPRPDRYADRSSTCCRWCSRWTALNRIMRMVEICPK